jgi:phosphoinositide-3-kinase regulatory subunit 4
MSYDASLLDLQGQVQEVVHVLLTDTATSVRRALVLNITPMCAFLGRGRTADILSLLTTHLNDRDWRLRTEFFGSMIGVSTCISVKGVDEYILPLLTGALAGKLSAC